MICLSIKRFNFGRKIQIFPQDDLVYLPKMNMLFKFYKRQTLSIKGICQLFLIATNLNRQIVNIFSKSLHLNQYDFNWYYKERNKLTLTNYRNLGPK